MSISSVYGFAQKRGISVIRLTYLLSMACFTVSIADESKFTTVSTTETKTSVTGSLSDAQQVLSTGNTTKIRNVTTTSSESLATVFEATEKKSFTTTPANDKITETTTSLETTSEKYTAKAGNISSESINHNATSPSAATKLKTSVNATTLVIITTESGSTNMTATTERSTPSMTIATENNQTLTDAIKRNPISKTVTTPSRTTPTTATTRKTTKLFSTREALSSTAQPIPTTSIPKRRCIERELMTDTTVIPNEKIQFPNNPLLKDEHKMRLRPNDRSTLKVYSRWFLIRIDKVYADMKKIVVNGDNIEKMFVDVDYYIDNTFISEAVADVYRSGASITLAPSPKISPRQYGVIKLRINRHYITRPMTIDLSIKGCTPFILKN